MYYCENEQITHDHWYRNLNNNWLPGVYELSFDVIEGTNVPISGQVLNNHRSANGHPYLRIYEPRRVGSRTFIARTAYYTDNSPVSERSYVLEVRSRWHSECYGEPISLDPIALRGSTFVKT
jgi:hypothetical protein